MIDPSLSGDVNDEELAPNGQLWVRLFEVIMCILLIIPQQRLRVALLKVKSSLRVRVIGLLCCR
jgi:hypothetical protein